MNIYRKLATELPRMNKTQTKITDYILNNRNSVSFYNVRKLAQLARVSEASVIRFSVFLGSKGYPELRETLQRATRQHPSVKDRLIVSYYAYQDNGILDVMKDDVNNILQTLESTDIEKVKKIYAEIISARRILITSCRSAVSLSTFFWYYLNMILDNVTLITFLSDDIERLESVTSEDLFIRLSSERYPKAAYQMMKFAKEKGCETISITDTLLSPLIPWSDGYLLNCAKTPTFLGSFVAPLSTISILITYIGRAKDTDLERQLQEYDNIWSTPDMFLQEQDWYKKAHT